MLGLCLAALVAGAAPARAAGIKGVWLRLQRAADRSEASRTRSLLVGAGPARGRLRQVFLREAREAGGATAVDVLTGPFENAQDALLEGLRLRRDPRFARAGVRLSDLAILLPTSFLPLPLQVDAKLVERLNPDRKQPYPTLGDLIVARASAFGQPRSSLPPLETATAQLLPWQPLLVLGESVACTPSRDRCLRWFEVLHPQRILPIHVPASLVVLHRDRQRVTLAGGDGAAIQAALWEVGRQQDVQHLQVMFRRGTLPPQVHHVALAEKDRPPFRLVVDRSGPALHSAAGNVVLRLTLRPWEYVRPPLWQRPAGLERPRPRPAGRERPRPGPAGPERSRPGPRPQVPRPRARPAGR